MYKRQAQTIQNQAVVFGDPVQTQFILLSQGLFHARFDFVEKYVCLLYTSRGVDPEKFMAYIRSKVAGEGMYYLLLDEIQMLDCFEACLLYTSFPQDFFSDEVCRTISRIAFISCTAVVVL